MKAALHPMLRGLLAAVVVAVAAAGAAAQPAPDEGRAAIDRLRRLPAAVQQVREVVRTANFGPFQLAGSCRYNGAWYCFWTHCTTFQWSWAFPGYVPLRDELDQRFERVQAVAGRFDERFAPVRGWLLQDLPALGERFAADAARLEAAEAVLRRMPAEAAEAQAARREIDTTIAATTARLDAGRAALQAGVAGLSGFNAQLADALPPLQTTRAGLEARLADDQRHLDEVVGGWPCGAADVARAGYAGVQATVRGQFDRVMQAAQAFGLEATRTDEAVSLVLGRLLAVSNAHRQVLDALRAAQLTPAGAVQQLRLHAAAAAWQDLADYARRTLAD